MAIRHKKGVYDSVKAKIKKQKEADKAESVTSNSNRVDFREVNPHFYVPKDKDGKFDEKASLKMLNASIVEAILDELENGVSLADAARLVYLDSKVVEAWFKENHLGFKVAVFQCQTYAKSQQVRRILIGDTNWNSAAWWLERKYSDEFRDVIGTGDEEKEQFIMIGNKKIHF